MRHVALLLMVSLLVHALAAEAQNEAYIEARGAIKVPLEVEGIEASYYFLFRDSAARGTANATLDLDVPLVIDLYALMSGDKTPRSATSSLIARMRIANESDPRLNILIELRALSNLTVGEIVRKETRFNANISDSGALSQRLGLRNFRVEARGAAVMLTEGRWLNATVTAVLEPKSGSSFVDRTVAVFIYSVAEELLANVSKYIKTLYPAAKFSYNVTLEQFRVRVSVIAMIPLGTSVDLSAMRSDESYRFLVEMSARSSKGTMTASMRYQLDKTAGGKLDFQGTLAGKISGGTLEMSMDMRVSRKVMERASAMMAATRLLSAPTAQIPTSQGQELPSINLGKLVSSLEAAVAEIERLQATTPQQRETATQEERRQALGINPVLVAVAVFTALMVALLVWNSRRG